MSVLLHSKYSYTWRSRHGAVTPSQSAVLNSDFKKTWKLLLSNLRKALRASIWNIEQRVTERFTTILIHHGDPPPALACMYPPVPPPDINLQHLPKMHFVKFTQVTQKQIKQRCLFLLPCPVYCTNQSADFQRALRRDAGAKRSTDWRQTDASMFQRKGRHFCLFQLPNSSSQTFYSFGFLVTGVTKSTNLKHPRFKRLSGSSGHASVLSVTVGRVL